MKQTIFTGAGVAIVTPMYADGAINWPKLAQLIDWQIENGTAAIIICGTTGEATTMSDDEHVQSIQFAIDKVNHRVPVIAGAGSNDTAYAVWLSKEAKGLGADALLHVTPYYNKTSQRGLVRHFNTIADATDLPVILYNVPSRTGVDIKPETYGELCRHPNIVAAKEANGNIAALAKTVYCCKGELDLYSGNDDMIVPLLSMGGKGVISVLSNVMPKETHNLCRLFFDGKIAEAAKAQADLMPLVDALFMDVNPIPVKEAMNLMGCDVGPCRLPLVEMSDDARDTLRGVLAGYNLLK